VLSKPRSARTLAAALVKLADRLAVAKVGGFRPAITHAERALASYRSKLTHEENRRLASYLNRHEPADNASAILIGGE